jgi:phosphoserine phosphatase RsbU/P
MSGSADAPGRAQDRLSRIESVTDTALAHVELEHMLRELVGRVRELLAADSAVVLMHDTATGILVPTATSGLTDEMGETDRVRIGQGFAGVVAAGKRPIVRDTLLGVPMLAEGDVVGVLHVGTTTTRAFTEDDVHVLQVAADRIALATRAMSSRAERAAATALQRSLLPGRLPVVPGATLAARYLPGGVTGVGGDWYDVFTLPSGRLGIVIGDVVGRGLPAAVVMGRLRSVVRAYALETEDPAVVLEKLDRKVSYFEAGAMATVAYAVFDPRTHRLEVSLAGHPPPVYVRPGVQGVLLDAHVDLPVGTDLEPRPRRVSRLDVVPGGVVCCYTDGLVERREDTVEEGLARLCCAMTVGPAENVCAIVMDKLLGGQDPSDDIAVVVLSRDE